MRRTLKIHWQPVIVTAHILLALVYGFVIPPYEAHDETGHVAYVHHLVNTRTLPIANRESKIFLDQSHQPPLYYLVVAATTFWLDRSDYVPPKQNVFALDGTNRRGARILLREWTESLPWYGAVLALHAARVISALLGGATIFFISKSARLFFSAEPNAAILATAIAAFNPQAIFMSAMVNNDAMVSLIGATMIYFALKIANSSERAPFLMPNIQAPSMPRSRFIVLGALLGLGLVSKNSALAFLGFAVIALVVIAQRDDWKRHDLLTRIALLLIAALVIAAPNYARNIVTYGKLLPDRDATVKVINEAGVIVQSASVALRDNHIPQTFVNAFRTFWGTFGWGNVQMPEWVYWIFFVFTALGMIGCVLAWRYATREQRTSIVLLALFAVSMLALPLYRAIYFQDPALLPGRYLMPSLTAYAIPIASGWNFFFERLARIDPRWQNVERRFLPFALALFAAISPFAFITPRYSAKLIAASNEPAMINFENIVLTKGVNGQNLLLPDREGTRLYARVKIIWQALQQTDKQYAFGVAVLGRDNEVLGSTNVYPQRGNYPSTNWNAGDTFEDEYDILLEKPCARLPALGRVSLSVFEFDDNVTGAFERGVVKKLQPRDAQGREVSPIVGRFKLDAPTMPYPIHWQEPRARFDDTLALRDVAMPSTIRAGETVSIVLTHELLGETKKEAVFFVHALDADGTLIAQDDHEPNRGAYPTDLWTPGECSREVFTMKLPDNTSGTLRFVTGMYDKSSQERLRASSVLTSSVIDTNANVVDLGELAFR
jgi:hypothetical protein